MIRFIQCLFDVATQNFMSAIIVAGNMQCRENNRIDLPQGIFNKTFLPNKARNIFG